MSALRYSRYFQNISFENQKIRVDGGESLAEYPIRPVKLTSYNDLRFFHSWSFEEEKEEEEFVTPTSRVSIAKNINFEVQLTSQLDTQSLREDCLKFSCTSSNKIIIKNDLAGKLDKNSDKTIERINNQSNQSQNFASKIFKKSKIESIKSRKISNKIYAFSSKFYLSYNVKNYKFKQKIVQKVKNLKLLIKSYIEFLLINCTVLFFVNLTYLI